MSTEGPQEYEETPWEPDPEAWWEYLEGIDTALDEVRAHIDRADAPYNPWGLQALRAAEALRERVTSRPAVRLTIRDLQGVSTALVLTPGQVHQIALAGLAQPVSDSPSTIISVSAQIELL
jgi:hypothetical protein